MSNKWSLSKDELFGDSALRVNDVLSALYSNCQRALSNEFEYPELALESIAFDFMALYDFMQRGIVPTAWRK